MPFGVRPRSEACQRPVPPTRRSRNEVSLVRAAGCGSGDRAVAIPNFRMDIDRTTENVIYGLWLCRRARRDVTLLGAHL
jgi:hypothetical protein